ncbi:MAG: hypothetical protein IJD60_02755 [Clostridia bacterium]|nr:hypothetical protein [Clostridia bacterium]
MNTKYACLGWTERCCICGRNVVSYHNPDPVREGEKENCCTACNELVVRARMEMFGMQPADREAHIRALRGMTYLQLKEKYGRD